MSDPPNAEIVEDQTCYEFTFPCPTCKFVSAISFRIIPRINEFVVLLLCKKCHESKIIVAHATNLQELADDLITQLAVWEVPQA